MSSNIPALSAIPGPRGYPLVGVMPELFRNPFEFMVEAARTYGGVVRLDLGPAKVYLVSHPDYVRHILSDTVATTGKVPFFAVSSSSSATACLSAMAHRGSASGVSCPRSSAASDWMPWSAL